MNAKQNIVHGRGPSNIYLVIFVAPLMFAGLNSHSPLLTMQILSILADEIACEQIYAHTTDTWSHSF